MKAGKKKSTIPPEKMVQYENLINANGNAVLKGATMPYTAVNGHMFSFLDKEGHLGLRLPTEEREEFIRKFKSRLFEAHGMILKEYVLVPESMFKKMKELEKYFECGYQYVLSMKPKPVGKKKTS